jgi:cold shock CspA family protein
MKFPPEISFGDIPRSDATERLLNEQVERLHRFAQDIIGCRIAVEQPHKQHLTGNPFRVRIEVTLPANHSLVVDKETPPDDRDPDLHRLIREAFSVMERQIKRENELRRGEVKTREAPRAIVTKLFPEQGYGFIADPEGGEQFYFHRNAVLHDGFDEIEVGTEVRFASEMGNKGPQATSVQIVGRPSSPGAKHTPDTSPD